MRGCPRRCSGTNSCGALLFMNAQPPINKAQAPFDIASFGEAMALFLADDGALASTATAFTRAVGGAEVNVLVQCARLGLKARYGGCVGADANGGFVLRALRAEGVECSGVVQLPDEFTGVLVRDFHSVRPIDVAYARRGAAAAKLRAEQLSDEWLGACFHLHATGITPALGSSASAATRDMLARARALGLKRSFDVNYRGKLWPREAAKATILPLLDGLDAVFGGADELMMVCAAATLEDAAAYLQNRGNLLVVASNGSGPVRVFDGAQELSLMPPRIAVVDVVGAGDAFVGGTLAGLIAGMPVASAVEQVIQCGALVVASKFDYAGQGYGAGGRLGTEIYGEVMR